MSGPDPGEGRSPSEAARHALSRRTLLQAALLGPAALPMAREAAAQATPATHTAPATQKAPQPKPIALPASDGWLEPWVWRPGDWPGQQLELNVVENENPGDIVGFGNPSAILFSYNGATPGPTIRMRGDETLLLRLRNLLGLNYGSTWVGPYPDPKELPDNVDGQQVNAKAKDRGQFHPDYCLGEHTNGTHAARTTNFHSHGLHVRPGRNPDGTHSDNVILRLIDPDDLEKRAEHADSPGCSWLRDPKQIGYMRDDEVAGFADYEFHIDDVQAELRDQQDLPPQPHPPGTHWYHPHCHGATHNQVASGMAGFLIIEGDVDAAISLALTGERHPDPAFKTGPYGYRERLMLLQRVFVTSSDPDVHTQDLKGGGKADPAVNGDSTPMTITMRPGAIERWRVLNGSVDGQGFQHVMVLKGQYAVTQPANPSGQGTYFSLVKQRDGDTFAPASRAEVESDKQHLYQLAFDGITLVEGDASGATYTIQDLAEQNAGTENPLDRELTGNPNQAMLANYEACFADAGSVRNAFVRPNEIYLAPGNRSDLLFQAPRLDGAEAQVYTVLSRGSLLSADSFQNGLQGSFTDETYTSDPQDIVVAYVVVAEETDADDKPLPAIDDFDVMDLIGVLPPVPQYLLPIGDDELEVASQAPGDSATPAAGAGGYRTRTITYSGWGSNDFPLFTTEGDSETARNFRAFVDADQQKDELERLELLRYAKIPDSDEYVLLAPNVRTMAIAGSSSTEVIDDHDPHFPIRANMARKFSPDDPRRPQILVDTAEEWAIYNASISLWADTGQKPLGQSGGHFPGQPLTRAEGQARFAAQPADGKTWRLQSKGVDHPFHMHQNPYWVMRVDVPDAHGNLVNILDKPRWQDVVWIPRNVGRVVFRSRFPDYVGVLVNHCHILLHEDHGMMQSVEITPFRDQANPEVKDRVTALDDAPEAVSAIYPPLSLADAWRQSVEFVDPNHDTGQTFPGFLVGDPPTG
jgi:FtsP/CotA-like multicopper oxidase with cupredoxin domain